MPDGSRKRRSSSNPARRQWYARHRALRFRRRFGLDGALTSQAESRPAQADYSQAA